MVETARRELGVQAPYHLLKVGNLELAVKRYGQGKPVICLHAIGHGARDFEAFASRLRGAPYEIICLDWPGHGSSPADTVSPSADAECYAALLALAVPVLCGERRPIIVGNSIGGAAALSYAARYPSRVRGLILCNPGGLAPTSGAAGFFIAAMTAFFKAGARGARWFPKAFAAYYRSVLPEASASEQRERIIAAGPEMAPLLEEAWRGFKQPVADLRARAATLDIPVLFAWAKQDKIIAWERSRAAATAMPNAEVVMLRGGHSAFLEDPDAFRDCFVAFENELPE